MDTFKQIVSHIENKRSFLLEAGAGSGKTYTLIQTLNYLIENNGVEFNKKIKKLSVLHILMLQKMKLLKE